MALADRYLLPLLRDNLPLLITTGVMMFLLRLLMRYRSQSPPVTEVRQNRHARAVVESGGVGEEEVESDDENLVDSPLGEDLPHIPFEHTRLSIEESIKRSEEFYDLMNQRRSVRFFSRDPVPRRLVENLVLTAGTSPSGAHTQPWTFVAVSEAGLKEEIRQIVEAEEEINYSRRMGKQWVKDLKGIGTTWKKEYLTEAPWILLIFKQIYKPTPDGRKINHYYHEISTAISGGILLAAIQNAGLVTLTSTPLNCGPALRTLLNRPSYEKLMLLLPLGYPAKDATVPGITRKPLEEILVTM